MSKRKLAMLMALLTFVGISYPQNGGAGRSEGDVASIRVSLKLDPRLTRSMYMGDRWISKARYVGASGQDTVEARAEGLDALGRVIDIQPDWIAADPEMVRVEPGAGSEVTIHVRRAGASRLTVTSRGVSRDLIITATERGGALQLEISQQGLEARAAGDVNSNTAAFGSEQEKQSYALGMNLVIQLRRQGIEIDPDSYVQGLRDAHARGQTLMTESEANAAINDLRLKAKRDHPTARAATNP